MTAIRAREMARGLLAEALPRRWAHVQGVAGKAERVAASLTLGDALAVAAWLHDVGYAPSVADTGFHPLDGARSKNGSIRQHLYLAHAPVSCVGLRRDDGDPGSGDGARTPGGGSAPALGACAGCRRKG